MQFHPNSNYVATGSSDRTVRLWDCSTGVQVRIMTGHKVKLSLLELININIKNARVWMFGTQSRKTDWTDLDEIGDWQTDELEYHMGYFYHGKCVVLTPSAKNLIT